MALLPKRRAQEETTRYLGTNLIESCGDSEDGLAGWAPSGSCTLSAHADEDASLPSLAAALSAAAGGDDEGDDSDEDEFQQRAPRPSGRYVLAARRASDKDGLCRAVSRAPIRPNVTYRVAGWVGLGAAVEGSHAVHVEVRVDGGGRPVGGGVAVVESGKWGQIKGSFRVDCDEPPRHAKVYVHGPPAGVDLKVTTDLQVCAVNKIPRLRHLRKKADKVGQR
jgi:hypothetical protein